MKTTRAGLGWCVALVVVSVVAGCGARAADVAAPSRPMPAGYIEGPSNVEDLVLIPGTTWVVASGGARPAAPQGHLYVVNGKDHSWKELTPDVPARRDSATFPSCTSPPAPETFSTQGLAIRPGEGGQHTLYVIGHGGREAVEVFAVDARGERPTFAWVGCVLVPEDVSANSVVALPGGGLAITSTFDPRDQEAAIKKALAGEPSGIVTGWTPRSGWRSVGGTELAGDNGLEMSADGRWLFVNAWSGKRIWRFSRGQPDGAPTSIPVDFLPDNLRWSSNGRLLVTGQTESVSDFLKCAFSDAAACAGGFVVLEVDPSTLATRELIREPVGSEFGVATTALDVGDEIWVGTYRGNRIAIYHR